MSESLPHPRDDEEPLAAATIASYRENLSRYLLPEFGTKLLRAIRWPDIKALLTKKRQAGLKANSVRLIRATASRLFGDAQEDGLITANPATPPRRHRRHRRRQGQLQEQIRPLSPPEQTSFLTIVARVGSKLESLLYLVLLDAGLRPSEALALRWPDIDTVGRTIHVQTALTLGGQRARRRAISDEQPETKSTKTGITRRVRMTQRLADCFAAYEAHIEAEALLANQAKPEFVFTLAPSKRAKDGQPRLLTEPWARHRFHEFLRRAGVARHHLYDLRHSYACELLAVAPIHFVAEQLGDRETTVLTYYAKWRPDPVHDLGYLDQLEARRTALRPPSVGKAVGRGVVEDQAGEV